MQLQLLQTFLAIYRAGSLTSAAQRLHLSQPAVSKHLRALESDAGRPLFIRLARGVAPTQEGEALARDIAPHLDALASISAGVALRGVRATVHIGGPADMLAAKVLPSLSDLTSSVRLRVRADIAEHLMEMLGADELDLVIATRHLPQKGIRFESLFHETLALLGNPAWAARLPPQLIERDPERALAEIPLVAYDEDLPLIRDYWQTVFGTTIDSSAVITVADLRAVGTVIAAGAGIGIVPRYLVSEAIGRGELIELHRPRRGRPTNEIFLAYRHARLRRPGVVQVRRRLVAAASTWEPPDPRELEFVPGGDG